jgi:SAM-dependent methyltransferase
MFKIVLPSRSTIPLLDQDGKVSEDFGYPVFQKDGVVDLLGRDDTAAELTARHYDLQWNREIDFLSFLKGNPEALRYMPSGQLGWPELIGRIRAQAKDRPILVYDAACGYGGLFTELFAAPIPEGLAYLGADIHANLADIKRPDGVSQAKARFVRWDISKPLPIAEKFDYVICRNALMHTADPKATLRSLAESLAPRGNIAVSVYARKALLREMLDDALRERITKMSSNDAFALAHQFSCLGRDLQQSLGSIVIKEDLPFFGMRAGQYGIQEFVYQYILKCWYNQIFGEKYSDVVNFDWYHPPHAHRFTKDEILDLFGELGLHVVREDSMPAQHYVEASSD